MKRIAIVTITHSGPNFGNRLQNYALQTVLERLGCVPETIFTAKNVRNSKVLSRLRWTARNLIKRTKRQHSFDRFNKRYIRAARRIRYEKLNDADFARDGYDAAIAGSDQVWNPEFAFNTDFEFLPFVPSEKRFSYAASFGIDDLPSHRRDAIAAFLREMGAISVREDTGHSIIRKLIGRDVPVHVDPTLLLTAADYEALAEKPPQPLPEHYILTYFLGEVSGPYRAFIDRMAAELGLPVAAVSELPGSAFYGIGPQHFLHLMRHADYVCTDSFHGTVFSMLFHRPFTCFYRQGKDGSMGSRIDTLLRIAGLESRLYGVSFTGPEEPIDYAAVDEALAQEREKAAAYLRGLCEQG